MRIGAGRWKNAHLPTAGPEVRPVPGRLRTSLFSVLGPSVDGARVLDLCAGVGALGLEAASRGALSVVLVDSDRRVAAALRRWVEERGAGPIVTVVAADARRGGWPAGPYDVAFVDPPFSVWAADAAHARPYLERAVESLAADGVCVAKCPARVAVPDDPRWTVVDRRAQGDVAYALLEPRGPGSNGSDAPRRGGRARYPDSR